MGLYDIDSFILNIHGGYDGDNKSLPGSTPTKSGFIERKQKLVLGKNGEEVLSSGNIFIDYDSTITLEDTVTFDGRIWQIIAIDQPKDFTTKKTRVYLL